MQRIFAIILFDFFAALLAMASYGQMSEPLQGLWVNEPGTRKVEFYSEGGKWYGKLIWVAEGTKGREGEIIFKDLVRRGKRLEGKLVAPRGTASCTILFKDDDNIEITGSKGGMSKSVYWKRVK